MIQILEYGAANRLLKRSDDRLARALIVVEPIVSDVRSRGDAAVREYAAKFDGLSDCTGADLVVATGGTLEPGLLQALEIAASNIRDFAQQQLIQSWTQTRDGRTLGQRVRPLESVGVYIPAGRYALLSTMLMTVIPAQVAGVREIVVVCARPTPEMLAVAKWLGITTILQLGGAQAIAALAYGTESIGKVQRIVGPGNAYVAAAKKLVSGDVGIDFVAGPSEIVIVANSGNPLWVALDMLAQCEHDVDARAILLTTSAAFAAQVQSQIASQLTSLSTADVATQSIEKNSAIIVCASEGEIVDLVNEIAPEHLSLPNNLLIDQIRNAGSIFVGPFSTEAAGDYASGPNHVLPTSGVAALRGGLSVNDFVKVITIQELDQGALMALVPTVATLARVEGLEAHARSAEARVVDEMSDVTHSTSSIQPRESVRNMRPYSPPTQGRGGKVRLDFNENTVGCSPRVLAAVTLALTDENVAMYPEYSEARTEIAEFLGVADDQLTFTNGTDEAIQLLINTFFEPDDELVILSPSYAMYRFYAEAAGVRVTEVTYQIEDDLVFPLEALTKKITNATKGVFIANPNNPTGRAISVDDVVTILEHSPQTIVLIDEAYVEFSQISVLPLLNRYPNLFVSRTFSKAFGMAGLRCGCLVSSVDNIAWTRRAQSPYSINALAIAAARAAVGDIEFVANYVREVVVARQMVQEALTRFGLRWFLSDGNFLLFDAGTRKQQILDQMKSAGILIRDRSHEIDGCVRVTIGTIDQMKLFITEMERAI